MAGHCYNMGKTALRSKHSINNLAFHVPFLALAQNPSDILSKSTGSLSGEAAVYILCLTGVFCHTYITFKPLPSRSLNRTKYICSRATPLVIFLCKLLCTWPLRDKAGCRTPSCTVKTHWSFHRDLETSALWNVKKPNFSIYTTGDHSLLS